MQCTPLLARVSVVQGHTLDSYSHQWLECLSACCLRQFKLYLLVFISAVWFAQ